MKMKYWSLNIFQITWNYSFLRSSGNRRKKKAKKPTSTSPHHQKKKPRQAKKKCNFITDSYLIYAFFKKSNAISLLRCKLPIQSWQNFIRMHEVLATPQRRCSQVFSIRPSPCGWVGWHLNLGARRGRLYCCFSGLLSIAFCSLSLLQ